MNDTPETYSAARNWLVTLPVVLLLFTAILFGTSAYIHAQLLNVGADLWPNYNYLRQDMAKPQCNPNPDIDKEVKKAKKKKEEQASGSLFDSGPVDNDALRQSFENKRADCRDRFKLYEYNHKMTQSASLRAYRTVELGMGEVNQLGQTSRAMVLVLLILICAIAAKAVDEHIALRPTRTRLDYRVSSFAQFAISTILALASLAWMQADHAEGGAPLLLHYIWIGGFSILALISAYQFWQVPEDAEPGGSVFHAVLTIPLYVFLGIAGFIYFFFMEHYPAGMAIQLTKMVKFAELYTGVGLFVWVGMMLKHTRLAELVFDVVRPWELAAEIITIVVVLAAALPTAYTGASGIFVLAIGAVIYSELRIAGTRRQLAVAATAMSGSMGVVLAPCLMVVIIAALNKQVTTTELYGWGARVFGLSALLFVLFVVATRESKAHVASPRKAVPGMLRALIPLVPYVIFAAIVIVIFQRVIGQNFDEFSAPVILPLVLVALLVYDRLRAKRRDRKELALSRASEPRVETPGFWVSVRAATADTSVLIGALLLLMAMSVVFGGVVQRSGMMDYFPQDLGNPWLATAILVVILVVIGMFMDPYGAIILVSATIAPVAYHNGIDPVHFWMMVLVAFELGYLSPPVALNQLLTRQVVGEAEFYKAKEVAAERGNFWRRHEHLLLPICVMASSLLIVAFAPLIYMHFIQ